jgi:putative PIN family toxin of toxin-antitoxin system
VIRITPDSNILISAIVFGGKAGELLELSLRGEIELVISPEISVETIGVLRDKCRFSDERVLDAWERIRDACTVIPHALQALNVVTDDPDDDRVIECAVAGNVDAIITGDKHLLRLERFKNIEITRLTDFLTTFENRSR